MQKLRRFISISTHKKLLLGFTFGLSLYSFLLMRFFKKYARFESRKSPIHSINPSLINDIRWAIFMVNKCVPWPNVCRHQAYQAKILLSFYRIPYQIFVGFKKLEGGKIEGHAWTVAGGLMITGFCNPNDYVVQSTFS